MTPPHAATRRTFIQTAGAALSAPLAVAAATVPAIAAPAGDGSRDRLQYLEDLHAIRALNQEYAKHVNAGDHEAAAALFNDPSSARIDPELRALAPDGFGDRDVVEIAADRQTATATIHCAVHLERPIGPTCPLVEMAREQGGGVVRRVEHAAFENTYVRRGGVWRIAHIARRSTDQPGPPPPTPVGTPR